MNTLTEADMELKRQASRAEMTKRLSKLYESDPVKPTFTPFMSLGKDMVERLPTMAGSILVLSDAGLLIAVLRRLKAEGLSFSSVKFIAHTAEVQKFVQGLGVESELVGYNQIQDWLRTDMGLKFDIIVGNPPYQSTKDAGGGAEAGGLGTAAPLWPKFIKASVDLLADSGHLALVVPQTWSSYGIDPKGTIKGAAGVRKYLSTGHLKFVDFSCGKFFNVGSTFSSFVFSNMSSGSTTIKTAGDRIVQIVNDECEWLPILGGDIAVSILKKSFWSDAPKFKLVNNGIEVRGNRKGHESVSETQTETFKFKISNTSAQYGRGAWLWSKTVPLAFGVPKLVFSDSGYAKPYIDEAGEIALGQHSKAFIIDSREQGEFLMSVASSKLVKFAARTFLESSAASDLSLLMFNIPIASGQMSDSELYDHFGLTQEEIDLIEATVK